MKVREVKVKVLENATAATLESDTNTWLAAQGERTLVAVIATGDRIVIAYTD